MAGLVWPRCLLPPSAAAFNINPFTRGGGPTLGGITRTTRTDRGFWTAELRDIVIRPQGTEIGYRQRRTWYAMQVALGGMAGLVQVPVYAHDTAPYPLTSGRRVVPSSPGVPHSDDTPFSDDSLYQGQSIEVTAAAAAAIGDTSISLLVVAAEADLVGVRFSYEGALYQTGPYTTAPSGGVWTLPISPAIRAAIPAGARLEFDRPTCLMHLASNDALHIDQSLLRRSTTVTATFVEAADYWNDLAAA